MFVDYDIDEVETLSEPKTTRYINGQEYLTSEDFWQEADRRIINVCRRYGVI